MSLDITILDDDDSPISSVGLGVNLHHQVISVADQLNLKLITRMSDYYEDVEFAIEELPCLRLELNALKRVLHVKDQVEIISKIEVLVNEAIDQGTRIYAIAD